MNKNWEPGEKEAWDEKLKTTPLYLCDYDKNVDCPKTFCAYFYPDFDGCRHTLNIECAVTDSNGNPVRITDVDEL